MSGGRGARPPFLPPLPPHLELVVALGGVLAVQIPAADGLLNVLQIEVHRLIAVLGGDLGRPAEEEGSKTKNVGGEGGGRVSTKKTPPVCESIMG